MKASELWINRSSFHNYPFNPFHVTTTILPSNATVVAEINPLQPVEQLDERHEDEDEESAPPSQAPIAEVPEDNIATTISQGKHDSMRLSELRRKKATLLTLMADTKNELTRLTNEIAGLDWIFK